MLMLIAKVTGHKMGKVFHKVVNAHVYENQISQLQKQMSNEPIECNPQLILNKDIKTLDDLMTVEVSDFELIGYESHEAIKFPFSV